MKGDRGDLHSSKNGMPFILDYPESDKKVSFHIPGFVTKLHQSAKKDEGFYF